MNSVQLIGNLTRDPELRQLPSGTAVCDLRLAVSGRRKTTDGGWEEVPNYFDVIAYGGLGETCAEHLAKGRKVAVTGRLEWSEWEGENGKRSKVEVVAADVDFLSTRASEQAGDKEPEPAYA